MNPRQTIAVAIAALLLLPVGALAADPLLSGYGGPGSGEQVVLGSKLLPPKNGDGSLRQAAPVPPASTAPTAPGDEAAPPAGAGSSESTGTAPAPGSSRQSGDPEPAALPGAAGGPAGEPAVESVLSAGYPTRAGEASGLPLSRTDLALLLLALLAAATVALVSRRVVRRTPDPLRPTAGDPLRG